MGRLVDSIEIEAAPEDVFEWFLHLDEHYLEWHPDHVSCRWLSRREGLVGSTLECVELLHGSRHTLRAVLVRADPPTFLGFRHSLPTSLISPGGSFAFEPRAPGCLFTATVAFRASALLERLAARRVDGLRAHMREESLNLKRLMEGGELAEDAQGVWS